MADYSQIISGIHGGNPTGHVIDEHEYIVINPETRQLEVPVNFNATIAFVGDINSQVVRFLCPKEYDGHSLKECSNHEIRWYNTSSGFGDKSPLEIGDDVGENFVLSWIVPPEATTKAGNVQCVISIYDTDEATIKYQWNTAIFSGFNIGATLENVETSMPVRSKILTLNPDTKNIMLPAGYNTTIASQYDIGTTHVYLQAPRYIHNMDLFDSSVGVYCGWHLPESCGIDRCQVSKQYSLIETDDLVLITWNVDQDLITNCSGNFSFELSVKQFNKSVGEEDKKLMKQWYSNINTALAIKPTLNISQDIVPNTGLAEGVLVDAAVDLSDIEQLIHDELYTGGTII